MTLKKTCAGQWECEDGRIRRYHVSAEDIEEVDKMTTEERLKYISDSVTELEASLARETAVRTLSVNMQPFG